MEMLARAIHCLNVGYFLSRHVLAPHRVWDDDEEVEKMAELMARGAARDGKA